MSDPDRDPDLERLCAGYRETVQDPPYDAADAALLGVAARQTRRLAKRRLAYYATAAALLAAVGLSAAVRSLIVARGPANIESRTAMTRQAPAQDRFRAQIARMSQPALLRQSDTGFLQETSALSSLQPDPACGTAPEVDLNAPGALDDLMVTKPGDYVRIRRIIAGVTRRPDEDVARWIGATFHAGNVSYEPIWLTSYPPKRRLRFCLGGTGYSAVLTITSDGARVEMARGPPRMRQRP